MSRKSRGKNQKAGPQSVPEEVLAEGSGPVHSVEAHVGIDEVVDARELAAAAEDVLEPPAAEPAAPKRKRGKRGAAQAEPEEPAAEAADPRELVAPEVFVDDAVDASAAPGAEELDVDLPAEGAAGATQAFVGSDTSDSSSVSNAELAAALEDGTAAESLDAMSASADEPHVTEDDLEEISDEEAAEIGAVLPTSAASMDAVQLKYLVEALVFAADKPMTRERLRQLTRVSDVRRLEQALAQLAEDYKDRGIVLQVVSGGYQFRTRTQFSTWVQQLIAGRPVRLSRAQLETLAIIAYRQPITRPEIDEIRGVDSSATIKLLLDRALVRILGKREEVGRPMLYGTTKEFLDFFSLNDLRELPTLREYSELTDESRRVMTDELGLDPDDPDGYGGGGSAESSDGGDGASENNGEVADVKPGSLEYMLASYSSEMANAAVAEDTADVDTSEAGAREPDSSAPPAVDDAADHAEFTAAATASLESLAARRPTPEEGGDGLDAARTASSPGTSDDEAQETDGEPAVEALIAVDSTDESDPTDRESSRD